MNRERKPNRRSPSFRSKRAPCIRHPRGSARQIAANAGDGKAEAVFLYFNEADAGHISVKVFHQLIEDDEILRVIDNPGGIAVSESDANVCRKFHFISVRNGRTSGCGSVKCPQHGPNRRRFGARPIHRKCHELVKARIDATKIEIFQYRDAVGKCRPVRGQRFTFDGIDARHIDTNEANACSDKTAHRIWVDRTESPAPAFRQT
mgnify:CR=1 FL=1